MPRPAKRRGFARAGSYDRVDAELRTGDPVRQLRQLRQVAADGRADVIVVGSAHSVRHRFWGSMPARLSSTAAGPVVVVP